MIILAIIMCFSTVSVIGCGGGGGVIIDATKTQLYVANYDGGYGSKWLDKIIKDFEEKYAEEEFETGKKGVQIILDADKSLHGSKISATIGNDVNEVYFTEAVYYHQFVKSGMFRDITTLLNKANPEDGNKTIMSKITSPHVNYLDKGGKFYAVPHYSSFAGIMYDIDLFEAKNLYFSGVAGKVGQFVATKTETKSAGPNGKTGDFDDGLPATYEEFFKLCDQMIKRGVTPFTWTGANVGYYSWLNGALHADYEGLEQMQLLYGLNGTAKNLITVDADGNVTPRGDVAITTKNGWEMYSQAGRYYGLEFLERMVSNPKYYHPSAFLGTYSHRHAQSSFLLDGIEDPGDPRVAMLVEGIWWEEEANADFKYAEQFGSQYSRQNRRVGYMPLPKATADKVGQKTTLLDVGKSFAFISTVTKESKVDLAEKFLAFCYTDANLQHFTTVTNTPKALKYDLTTDQYNSLSNFGRSVWDVYSTADMAYPFSNNALVVDKQSELDIYQTYVTKDWSSALVAFKDNKTSEQFFNGIVDRFSKAWWEGSYSAYWA